MSVPIPIHPYDVCPSPYPSIPVLSVRPYTHPSLCCLSVPTPIHPCVRLSVPTPIHPYDVHLSIPVPVHPYAVCPSLCPFAPMLSVRPYTHPSLCPSVCPYTHPSLWGPSVRPCARSSLCCLSVPTPIHPYDVRLSVPTPIRPHVRLAGAVPVCGGGLCLSLPAAIFPFSFFSSLHPSVPMSVCLSLCPFTPMLSVRPYTHPSL